MNSAYFSFFDMAICGIPALGFGVWQLVSVNREIAKDKAKAALAPSSSPSPSPESAGHAVGEHRLDHG